MKKTITVFAALLLCLSLAACTGSAPAPSEPSVDPAAYSANEEESISIVSDDLIVVTDETFAETVVELVAHTGMFDGIPYQMQGVFKRIDGTPCLTRILRNGGEETEIALPLALLYKEYTDGEWIEAVGIAATGEINGVNQTVLDLIAVKALPQSGNSVLDWDGDAHHHEH